MTPTQKLLLAILGELQLIRKIVLNSEIQIELEDEQDSYDPDNRISDIMRNWREDEEE